MIGHRRLVVEARRQLVGRAHVEGRVRPEAGQPDVGQVPVAALDEDVAGLELADRVFELRVGDEPPVRGHDAGVAEPLGDLLLHREPADEGLPLEQLGLVLEGAQRRREIDPALGLVALRQGETAQAHGDVLLHQVGRYPLVEPLVGRRDGGVIPRPGHARSQRGEGARRQPELGHGLVEEPLDARVAADDVEQALPRVDLGAQGGVGEREADRVEVRVADIVDPRPALVAVLDLVEGEERLDEGPPGQARGGPLLAVQLLRALGGQDALQLAGVGHRDVDPIARPLQARGVALRGVEQLLPAELPQGIGLLAEEAPREGVARLIPAGGPHSDADSDDPERGGAGPQSPLPAHRHRPARDRSVLGALDITARPRRRASRARRPRR